MEALKIAVFIYAAGTLIHFYFLPFKRSVLWPMVILALIVYSVAISLNALANILYFMSKILTIYSYYFSNYILNKGVIGEKPNSGNNAA